MRISALKLLSISLLFISTSYSTEFGVQGVLRDPGGRTVQDGTHAVTFKLYESQSGGDYIWTETHSSVDVKHGVFSVLLGSVNEITASFSTTYYLGIKVDDGQEMTPRTQLTTSPYSKAVLGTDNVFPSVGNIGVGTQNPTAALHIISDEDNKLFITDSEGSKYVKVNADGEMEISGNLKLTAGSAVVFSDNTSLNSSDLGGSASSLGNPNGVLINAGENEITLSSGEYDVTINDGHVAARRSDFSVSYDIDNPAFYLDPSSSSKLSNLNTGAITNTGTITSTGNITSNGTITSTGNITSNGTITAGTNLIAKGFADSDNSSYYLNPDNLSSLKTLNVGFDQNFGLTGQVIVTKIKASNIGEIEIGGGRSSNWSFIKSSGGEHDLYIGTSDRYNEAGYFRNLFTTGGESVTSDRKFKENIQDLDSEQMLTKLLSLQGVSYDAKKDGKLHNRHDESKNKDIIGVIAQDVNRVFPTIARYEKDHDFMSVTYSKLIPVMIESIKQLKKEKDLEVQQIKKEYDQKLSQLMSRIEALENQ